jgi:hypothetical protein
MKNIQKVAKVEKQLFIDERDSGRFGIGSENREKMNENITKRLTRRLINEKMFCVRVQYEINEFLMDIMR